MGRKHLRINRLGFAEYEDMVELSCAVDTVKLAGDLSAIVERVLSGDRELLDSLTDGAQADFVVPLGMCAELLFSGQYSVVELVSAACTVRYCAEAHMREFPEDLVQTLSRLPR
ncbi:hypothetical protein [Spongiactinospora sp. 9N601]|uniref:hypothetical protein n=1 Tax=Spongiactinospora sp. 9N601 TaxID=3375149 RepID=UPI0037B2274F